MDKRKWIGVVVIVAVVAIAGAVYWQSQQKSAPAAPVKQAFDPKNPPFILGSVESVSGDKITFKAAGEDYTANVLGKTQLTKEVKGAKGATSTVTATMSDLQPKSTIVVYFSVPPSNHTYMADKVEIIP